MVDAAADFARDTRVERTGPGRYAAHATGAWSFRGPSGGVLTALALRATAAELGEPRFSVRSSNTIFCSPVPEGPVEIRVQVLRRGNVAAQVRAALGAVGAEPGLEVSATFGRDRSGPEILDARPPDVPPPEEAPILERSTPVGRRFLPRIFSNIEVRLALGHDWWTDGWEAGEARLARWMRYRRTPRLEDGRLDPLAIPPVADTMPPSVIQKLGPGFEPFVAPSLDLTVHFLEDTSREWLLLSTHCRRTRAGYGSAEVEVWDDEGRLVGYATQMWIFRRPPPELA